MAAIWKGFTQFLFEDLADPRVYNWPLMARPWYTIGIVIAYLFAIYVFLPKFMSNRKPYDLRGVIAAYNLFQVIACTALVYGVLTSGWITRNITLRCHTVNYSEDQMHLRMAKNFWWNMIIKLIEFVETIFFVLRKKSNQVSALHVYHHVSTACMGWLSSKYIAGGMMSFTIIINSLVHIIMYSYYFLSSFGPIIQKKIVWMKPKITMIQMFQLAVIALHTSQALLPSCKIPPIVVIIYLPNIIINIWLFIRFYKQAYLIKKAV